MRLTDEQRAELLAERDRLEAERAAAAERLRDIGAALAADRVARLAELDAQTSERDLGVRLRERESRAAAARRAARAGRGHNPDHPALAHEDRREDA